MKKKKTSNDPPNSFIYYLPEKVLNPSQISSSLIKSEPNKSSQTMVQGNYTFYNPYTQNQFEDRKIPNEFLHNKTSNNNYYKNSDGINKINNPNYSKDNYFVDKKFSNQVITNKLENYEYNKIYQLNNLNKVPQNQNTQNIISSNQDKINNLAINKNYLINNVNHKKSDLYDENKKIKQCFTGDVINNSNLNPLSIIRTMNIKEVKEFVPKNFVIIKKENNTERNMNK